ncbi:ATP-dependent zinc metalloprotease FtsH [Deinococcus peraridilitoris]|uniref:ATP-dependent zinc metalloprotease FtsH n=1 Tax=Deinococcus peraridilitoris (strain DSM 19664 / LMG 22246 / CIP 109416 / KR-200) TaxID=937777 RepID=L0A695_DEIPD|nr:ATP-dependent zinc metalloprotease FtsH [Deinococcus peraridilitoris]AFZ68682.1 ATP-dependent metalloprotease FtsH [Deinococcus peraridilitoris DSM 19664]
MKQGNWVWWLLAAVIAVIVVVSVAAPRPKDDVISLSNFTEALNAGRIQSVRISFDAATAELQGSYTDGRRFVTRTITTDPLINLETLSKQVGPEGSVSIEPVSRFSWISIISTLLTVALIGVLILYLLRSNRGNGGGDAAGNFGKSRAHLMAEGSIKLNFTDVAGCDEAKADLQEVVEFLKSPERFHQLGARIPHGILLVGPPGSGKTLLAKAVAGEARVPYFSISGSDFVEMFVGVGAARVRDLFEQAKKAAPCIVFIDEIDAVGRKRGMNFNGGNDEREQTLNQLLVEMDGFESKHDIIILAATNRPDVLDAALLRPGRFDRQVVVDAPDVRGREYILKIHARKKPLDPSVNLALVAKRTVGMVGADLENLLNEAALLAARAGRRRIIMRDLDDARDRVLMGPERRSLVIPEKDKRVTAYHEVGHALVAQLLPHADRVHKLTVVPRGRAAGMAMYTPEDRMHYTGNVLSEMICVALAGQAAEEIALGQITTGAQNDFQKATSIARKMVTEWGMSEVLGKVAHAQEQENFLGGGTAQGLYSETTAQVIDAEVKRILDAEYERAKGLLEENLHHIHRIVEVLLTRETLSGEEFTTVLAGGTLPEVAPEHEEAESGRDGPSPLGALQPGKA